MSEWKPSQSDIDWTRNHINKINDGGLWVIPAAYNSELTIRHSTKSYDAVIRARHPAEQETVLRTMTVLKELGYMANTILWDSVGIDKSRIDKFQEDNA